MTQDIIRHIRERYPPDQPIRAIDGRDLRALFHAAYAWLERHYDIVNRMNVFPVPDGDTGTNMLLTVKRAWEEIAEEGEEHAGRVLSRLAHGALMGARGNSGVIFSQILRGMVKRLADLPQVDAEALAEALEEGTHTAYRGVSQPVEGTILTVVREAAEAARAAARLERDLRFLFEQTLQAAQEALANTPNLLPVLKQAGVVDSGGMGLCYIWEGMTRALRGEVIARGTGELATADADLSELPDEWGYDVQFLIYADQVDEAEVRQHLEALGGHSIVVGKAGNVIKVHVHGDDPGPFLSYGASLGHLDDIVVENMTLQTLRRKGKAPAPPAEPVETPVVAPSMAVETHPAALLTPAEAVGRVAVVAVSPGPGFDEILRSLGVQAIVSGGQTMNPSTADILQAVEGVPQEEVIILPNNKNIVLAAEEAAKAAKKKVRVVPSRSLPQGIAAMLAFNPDADVDDNRAGMTEALNNVVTGRVTVAVSDAHFDEIDVKAGHFIGLVEDALVTTGEDLDAVVLDTLEKMDAHEREIITLYYGHTVTEEQAAALADKVRDAFPDQDVEVLYGGQPHYPYILSAE